MLSAFSSVSTSIVSSIVVGIRALLNIQYLTGTLYTEIMFNKFFNAQPTNLCNCFFNVCTDIETMCVQSLRCSHLILACRESLEDRDKGVTLKKIRISRRNFF